ncbi:protein of unknown function [Hyphomicrobium sp. 1Nfss2.1]|uniref:hypothetical protein n=1 Tax=Hyphomicrobium sp. 1Nfss2.1 TaxID=3413936 RepID=UPI003C7B93FA
MWKLLSGAADFLFDGWGKALLGAGLFAAMFTWWQVDRASQRHVGRLEERLENRRQDDEAVKKADQLGAASRDPRVRGVRDPYAGPDVGRDLAGPQVPTGN